MRIFKDLHGKTHELFDCVELDENRILGFKRGEVGTMIFGKEYELLPNPQYKDCTHIIDRKNSTVIYVTVVDDKILFVNDQELNGRLSSQIIGKTIQQSKEIIKKQFMSKTVNIFKK